MSRWIRFFLAILVGIALGLLYGWVLSPVEYVDTSPDTLKIDYKTDFVLMVAESYHADQDLPLAIHRLSALGGSSAADTVHRALLFAEPRYTDADLGMLRALYEAVQSQGDTREISTP